MRSFQQQQKNIYVHILQVYGDQKTACEKFSPSSMWVLRTELRFSGLTASIFTH